MLRTATAVPRKHTDSAERLIRAFAEMREALLAMLLSLLGSHDDAQDAVQETFLKCWRARGKLHRVRNLRAWIFRVGLNAAKDLQRNAWRRRVRPLNQALPPAVSPEFSPAEILLHNEALERLRAALVDLRPEEQDVFLLRQNGSLTYEQIAVLRRRPVGTVKTQMRAALHKLRKVLQDRPG